MCLLRTDQRIRLAICVGAPVLFGLLSGLLNHSAILDVCKRLHKPPLTAPGIICTLLWLIVYIAIGLASYLVSESHVYKEEKLAALGICGGQLLLHTLWIILFFHSRMTFLGAFIHLLYTLVVVLNTLVYLKIKKQAGCLMFPCVLLCLYYTYLTIALIFVN